jgi:formylmethanofuran dehydrogenase subunit C
MGRASRQTIAALSAGYLDVLGGQIDNIGWLVDHEQVAAVYSRMSGIVGALPFNAHDIEAVCARIDTAEAVSLLIPGPAGLFVAALVNNAPEPDVRLHLAGFNRRFHFLGYRLPTGKILTIEGDAGDLTGAGLCGGQLTVSGSVGKWCGIGMIDGRIRVNGQAGKGLGLWMHGGAIEVVGSVHKIGRVRYGGTIVAGGRTIGIGTGKRERSLEQPRRSPKEGFRL